MLQLGTSIYKELVLLIRDKAGLIILFLMPVVLIFVMTLIQDSTFKKLEDNRVQILFINYDADSLGIQIEKGLNESNFFEIVKSRNNKQLDERLLKKLVSEGQFQVGVIIPQNATEAIRDKAEYLIEQSFNENNDFEDEYLNELPEKSKVIIYFDPVIKHSFKFAIKNALDNFIYVIESKIIFSYFAEEVSDLLPEGNEVIIDGNPSVVTEEKYAFNKNNEIIPNSVQHNVPAWAVFAMFFIIIPLTSNIIKERNSGVALRLKLMPGLALVATLAKALVYIFVCIIQFILMVLVAIYVLPLFGLPVLDLGSDYLALIVMLVCVSLAATGYGIMIGTISTTHEQAASFGSVSIIILAALGGIWVPVFVMPDIMQKISVFSPLNWGLEGFYYIFLRGSGFMDILPFASLLLGFSLITILISLYYQKLKNV